MLKTPTTKCPIIYVCKVQQFLLLFLREEKGETFFYFGILFMGKAIGVGVVWVWWDVIVNE